MQKTDRELIEELGGPLWSGAESLSVGGREFTLKGLKQSLDLMYDDIIGIDLFPLAGGTFAWRYYDGDDRRIVAFVLDAELNLLREIRAHIADWLGDDYYEAGTEGMFAGSMVQLLREKVRGGSLPPVAPPP